MRLATIGIPTYNRELTLERCLAAASAQDYPALEIVVVDNASVDSTEALCLHAAQRDQRIRYVRQPTNLGAPRNFETALRRANGDYFMWLADDDVISPNYVSACVARLEISNSILVAGRDSWRKDGALISQPGVSYLHDRPLDRILDYLRTVDTNAIFYGVARRQDLLPLLPIDNQIGADWRWLMTLLARGPAEVLPHAEIHRDFSGMSRDIRALGVRERWGRFTCTFPMTSLALRTFAFVARSPTMDLPEPRSIRILGAAQAGAIVWLRLGASAELVDPVRHWLRDHVAPSHYDRLRRIYRPARLIQTRVREKVLTRKALAA